MHKATLSLLVGLLDEAVEPQQFFVGITPKLMRLDSLVLELEVVNALNVLEMVAQFGGAVENVTELVRDEELRILI